MALPYAPRTLPRFSPVTPTVRLTVRDEVRRERTLTARILTMATSPTVALVAMLLGLALLFVLPVVGLPFVALVVLPAVVYHLRAEQRVRLRRSAR